MKQNGGKSLFDLSSISRNLKTFMPDQDVSNKPLHRRVDLFWGGPKFPFSKRVRMMKSVFAILTVNVD